MQRMTPEIRQGIFAGESGGDYDALYGYANRPGGRYENVRPSQMTVGQVIDFTQPTGEYGQGVKRDIGRVATPVGAYQVVGTTLREAVEDLGLDPSTPFNKDTQDLIGDWVYNKQGTGAWEGYKGPRAGGGQVTQSTRGPQMNGQQQGGTSPWERIIQSAQQAPTGGPKDMLAAALMAFAQNAPRAFRGQGMDFSGMGGSRRTTNASIEWLRNAGRDDLAAAVAAGAIDPKEALSLVYREGKDGGETFEPISAEEAAAMGLDPEQSYQRGTSGKISQIGGSGVTINTGDPKLTEGQSKNTLFYSMAKQALPVLSEWDAQGMNIWQPMLPSFAQTPEYRKFDNAAKQFSEAILRIETGAAAQESEIDRVRARLFPVPGDPPDEVARKKELRDVVLSSVGIAAGPGKGLVDASTAPDAPAAPVAPVSGDDPLGLRGGM